jgi:hypothetical protein
MALMRELNIQVIPWLKKIAAYVDANPEISGYINLDNLAEAMLNHEDTCRDFIIQQVRNAELSYVYALKESRNPYYLSAFQEMMAAPNVDPHLFRYGVSYLRNVNTPESTASLKQLYDQNRQVDSVARMYLCEALVKLGDNRGLADAFQLMSETFADQPEANDPGAAKKATAAIEDQREAAQAVIESASSEAVLSLVSQSIDTTDVSRQRAILKLLELKLRLRQSSDQLAKPIEEAIRRWANAEDDELASDARKLLAAYGIIVVDSKD